MRIPYFQELSGVKMRFRIGFFILIALFATSVFAKDTGIPSNQNSYPLAPHTRWTYHYRQELADGVHFGRALAKLAKGNVMDGRVISEVTGTDLINGTSYVRVESHIEGTPWITTWLRLEPNGLFHGKTVDYDAGGEQMVMVPPQKLLSSRLEKGESWSWKASKEPVRIQAKVVGPATVRVPVGEFEATQVLHEMTIEIETDRIVNVQLNRWFVPGIGYIKMESKSFEGKRQIDHTVWTLEKFEPGKPTETAVAEKSSSTGVKSSSSEGLAVQEHEAGGVDVVLLEVKRTAGGTMTVRWKYVNKTPEKKQLTNTRTGWLDPYRLSYGAYIIDNANKTKYNLVTDANKHPVAGTHGNQNSYIFLGPNQTLVTWAKFPEVPADAEKVTVSIPGAPPFEEVPVRK
jgi:hypothetical protein